MRRVISAALAMVMVMAISIPAFAIDKEGRITLKTKTIRVIRSFNTRF